jgi:hypothetical protein
MRRFLGRGGGGVAAAIDGDASLPALVRSYIPIRGLYDPETNVPHVYRATQAREVMAFERSRSALTEALSLAPLRPVDVDDEAAAAAAL